MRWKHEELNCFELCVQQVSKVTALNADILKITSVEIEIEVLIKDKIEGSSANGTW